MLRVFLFFSFISALGFVKPFTGWFYFISAILYVPEIEFSSRFFAKKKFIVLQKKNLSLGNLCYIVSESLGSEFIQFLEGALNFPFAWNTLSFIIF